MKKEITNMNLEELLELDNEILTEKDLEELEESELVKDFESLGTSGQHPNCTWYSVTLINDETIDVYCKF